MAQENDTPKTPRTGSAGRTAMAVTGGVALGAVAVNTVLGVANAIGNRNLGGILHGMNPTLNHMPSLFHPVAAAAALTAVAIGGGIFAQRAWNASSHAATDPAQDVKTALTKANVTEWTPEVEAYAASKFITNSDRNRAETFAVVGHAAVGAAIGKGLGWVAGKAVSHAVTRGIKDEASANRVREGVETALNTLGTLAGAYVGGRDGMNHVAHRAQQEGNKVMTYAERLVESRAAQQDSGYHR